MTRFLQPKANISLFVYGENMKPLERFIEAQNNSYQSVLEELKEGKKKNHWMWYMFPQMEGLGNSTISKYYAIQNLEEAKNYLEQPLLGTRLIELCNILLLLASDDVIAVFGPIDAMKLKSCMTLFDYVSDKKIFYDVLLKFFDGERDEKTIHICKELEIKNNGL